MHNKLLFLTLRTFSAVGGIEKVCKIFCKAIAEVQQQLGIEQFSLLSMYDEIDETDTKYINKNLFKNTKKSKVNFVLQSIKQGTQSKVVIISHINLLSVGYLIKILSPSTKLIMLAHGIEVWDKPTYWRRKMYQKCDKILCVSNFTKNKLQKYVPQEDKLIVLNNCIDPFLPPHHHTKKDDYLLQKLGFNKSDIILLTLTRLSSKELYKGYDKVLVSLAEIKKKHENIKYLIVGKYDQEEKERLDIIIKNLNLSNQVVFTNYIPDEELAAHYGIADVYVMPSKKEGFGIVFIEAMYYGLPVIAGNMDGSTDALLNGKLGILVNPDKEDEIATAIEKVINNLQFYQPDKAILMQHFGFETYKNNIAAILKAEF